MEFNENQKGFVLRWNKEKKKKNNQPTREESDMAHFYAKQSDLGHFSLQCDPSAVFGSKARVD